MDAENTPSIFYLSNVLRSDEFHEQFLVVMML